MTYRDLSTWFSFSLPPLLSLPPACPSSFPLAFAHQLPVTLASLLFLVVHLSDVWVFFFNLCKPAFQSFSTQLQCHFLRETTCDHLPINLSLFYFLQNTCECQKITFCITHTWLLVLLPSLGGKSGDFDWLVHLSVPVYIALLDT